MARPNAQIFAFSNAGDDKSIVLNDLLEKGRAAAADPGLDETLGLFEWSAPHEVKCTCGRPDGGHTLDCRLQDRAAWAQANPSLGYTVTEEALASALATDPEPIFRTECLCQHVPDLTPEWSVIPQGAWVAVADPASEIVGPMAFALDVAPDREYAAIAVAGRRADGLLHVEITGRSVLDHRPGTDWVMARAAELVKVWKPVAFVVDPSSPAGSLITKLEDAGVTVTSTSAREHAQACGQIYDAVVKPRDAPDDWVSRLRHLDQAPLSAALAGAEKRTLGDAWAWARRGVSVDISPLVAATLALWGFETAPAETNPMDNIW
jgi:hypothetical protein